MAHHLAAAGHSVSVFNRSSAKVEQWLENNNGKSVSNPVEAAADAEFIVCCVGNDDDVRQICLGDSGVLSVLAPGGIIIDHTTTSATKAHCFA